MVAGLTLQALALGWLAAMTSTSLPYTHMLIPFIMGGIGMSLVFAPSANAVLSAVRVDQAGQASGALVALLLPFRTPRAADAGLAAAEKERGVAEPSLAVLAGDAA